MRKYSYTITDRCEGTINGTVHADSEDEALEEASIAAAENGCRFVEEIIVEERIDTMK